jgi:hypothetical protein
MIDPSAGSVLAIRFWHDFSADLCQQLTFGIEPTHSAVVSALQIAAVLLMIRGFLISRSVSGIDSDDLKIAAAQYKTVGIRRTGAQSEIDRGETFAARVSSFRLSPDGQLSSKETVAERGPGNFADRLTFDVEGGAWITCIVFSSVGRHSSQPLWHDIHNIRLHLGFLAITLQGRTEATKPVQ